MRRILFAKIEVWLVLFLVLVGILGTVLFAGVVLNVERGRHQFGQIGPAALAIAEIPITLEKLAKSGQDMQLRLYGRFEGEAGWSLTDGKPTGLPGYLIYSYFDPAIGSSVIEMVTLNDASPVYQWRPDMSALLAGAQRTTHATTFENWTSARFRQFHPYLMADGGLLIKETTSPLIRIDACAQPIWMRDEVMFHHSTEPDGRGGFWIPALIAPSPVARVVLEFRDDSLVHITAEGKILTEISMGDMLIRHGLEPLIFSPDNQYRFDPMHLNDIQPVLEDGPYWQAGDLFLSFRHISTVMLYRPSTDEIIWHRQGPWMGQHDVDILDDHRIAVFNNNASNRGIGGRVNGSSDIAVYDFATDRVSHPYADVLARESVEARSEGLYTFLPGGAYIVEDHNSGRVLVFSPEGRKLAQFINRRADGNVYQIGWGRYVDQAEGDAALKQIAQANCADNQ
ncbi:MAG: arylsulfotransferase family protein [Albidovulum sp.]